MVGVSKRLSRKAIYALIAITAVAVFLVATFAFVWQTEKPSTENKGVDVNITDFYLVGDWGVVGGLAFDLPFNLTVKNNGQTDVSGLVLRVKMFANNSEVQVGNYFFDTYENGTITEPLRAGEIKEYNGTMLSDLSHLGTLWKENYSYSYKAVIILNNSTLDEKWNK
jgi:hypothetical protein